MPVVFSAYTICVLLLFFCCLWWLVAWSFLNPSHWQVLVQSSSSSRARSKRMINQTMFLTSLILGIRSVTVHVFVCPKHTDDDTPSLI
jgi:hypothetical protein